MSHTATPSLAFLSSCLLMAACSGGNDRREGVGDTATAAGTDTSATETQVAATDSATSSSTDTGAVEPTDTVIPDTGTPDTGTPDTGTPDTGTPDTSTGPSCDCADPNASCACHNGAFPQEDQTVCVSDTVVCNAITLCPSGYRCDQDPGGNRCVCEDLAICGVVCAEDGSCPCGLLCSPAGRCVEPPPCAFSETCDADERCLRGDCVAELAPGTKADGSECGTSSECAGGSCAFRTCTKRCETNADCPDGLICAESDNLENNGCVLPSATGCQTGCTAAEETCAMYGGCGVWCVTNADCGAGHCEADLEREAHPAAPFLFYRLCVDGASTCEADELELVEGELPGPGPGDEVKRYCTQGAGCAEAADCGEDYPLCLTSDFGGPPLEGRRGVCGRTVAP